MRPDSSRIEVSRREIRMGVKGNCTFWGEFCKALNLVSCGRNWKNPTLKNRGWGTPRPHSQVRLLFEEGVDGGLGDGFVDFRFGAAGGDGADGLAVDLDGQAALVREVVWEGEGFDIALFHVVGGVF